MIKLSILIYFIMCLLIAWNERDTVRKYALFALITAMMWAIILK